MANQKENRRTRIKKSIRSKVSGTAEKPRLSVFRSNTGVYAQIIDDMSGKTLVSASSKEIESKGLNIEISKNVGKKLAEKAVSNGISTVVFDRGGYLFHGKVKALAEGAREGGLKF
ncbi:50S ribosomal protein L18 [Rhodocytophaga aerolata]|jgi:large subunit ribosomal protein L18|uniref:Large ribosomal subunit protein uL18 n=1 Tax=Rhodocytophaga aerolata TaxID=455078 RepID=A0ABT8R8P1_9BACT|nr:50S ribosomal protein L18 [Rhodocytophaga aerolata]MDO1448470.1 50S ribosomal protein L18 [Rhodocytophaga aerolata]